MEEHRSIEVVHAVGHPTYDSVDFLTDDFGELDTALRNYSVGFVGGARATYLGCFIAGDSCTKNLLRAFAAKELIRTGISDAHTMLPGGEACMTGQLYRIYHDGSAIRQRLLSHDGIRYAAGTRQRRLSTARVLSTRVRAIARLAPRICPLRIGSSAHGPEIALRFPGNSLAGGGGE